MGLCSIVRPGALGALGLMAGLSFSPPAAAQEVDATLQGLQGLSLDELAELPVTSAAKRAEPLSAAAAAVFVINEADLRASGARSLPEALRLAPQLEISRIDALDYSITARGFAGFESANKLLVMIDGRSVWTPLFSGVDWDQHHLVPEDVGRIEVVSGPGGTLWGANAVNGVINVTTKSAYDTQGWLVSAQAGDKDSDLAVRWGAPVGAGAVRAYVTGFRRGELRTLAGQEAGDGWDSVQGGFRYDRAGERSGLTLQGDAHSGSLDNSVGLAGFVRGQNLLGRWNRQMGETGSIEVQAYYDHFTREARLIHDELTTFDVQAQANLEFGAHQLVAGAGARRMEDDFRTLAEPQLLSPPQRRTTISNVFVQDEVQLRPYLSFTAGLKLEDNSYTKAEWIPNARLAWEVTDRQLLWVSASRAIRNPSRIERDFQIPGLVVPGRMGSENLVAYEVGYRGRMADRANLTINLFYHDYDSLRTNDLTPPGVLPIFVGNSMSGETWGVEAWGEAQPAPWWRLSLGGALLETDFHLDPGSLDVTQFKSAGADPNYWVKLRSVFRLGERLDLTAAVRVVGDTPDSPATALEGVPAYQEANLRLAWRLRDDLELSVLGENLLHDQHLESIDSRREAIPRSISLGLRWTR